MSNILPIRVWTDDRHFYQGQYPRTCDLVWIGEERSLSPAEDEQPKIWRILVWMPSWGRGMGGGIHGYPREEFTVELWREKEIIWAHTTRFSEDRSELAHQIISKVREAHFKLDVETGGTQIESISPYLPEVELSRSAAQEEAINKAVAILAKDDDSTVIPRNLDVMMEFNSRGETWAVDRYPNKHDDVWLGFGSRTEDKGEGRIEYIHETRLTSADGYRPYPMSDILDFCPGRE